MATYKLIQDIEAEDKLLGPFSLRQCIYAALVLAFGFLIFQAIIRGVPYLAIPMFPPAILFLVLAAPFGHDQSSEVWLLAKIRFHIKPRLRIWDQSGLQELVTITVPKKVETSFTKGLNEFQVQSRLQALAQTIDTRGWAVKGVDVNMYTSPAYLEQNASDRLLDPTSVAPMPVADFAVSSNDDMLDTQNNRVAQQVDQLVNAKSKARREAILEEMHQANTDQPSVKPAKDRKQSYATFDTATTIRPGSHQANNATAMGDDFTDRLLATQFQDTKSRIQARAYGNTRILQPGLPAPVRSNITGKSTPDPAKLYLASNDDLSVATIARQANQPSSSSQNKDDDASAEVIVPLR